MSRPDGWARGEGHMAHSMSFTRPVILPSCQGARRGEDVRRVWDLRGPYACLRLLDFGNFL